MARRESLGLDAYIGEGAHGGEKRMTVRLASGNQVVAWFRAGARTSDGTSISDCTWQFVRRHELTARQVVVVKRWLRKQVLAALSK